MGIITTALLLLLLLLLLMVICFRSDHPVQLDRNGDGPDGAAAAMFKIQLKPT